MEKKVFLLIMSFLLVFIVGVVTGILGTFLHFKKQVSHSEISNKQGILYIKGQKVENNDVTVYKDYAILPLKKILLEFDYKIQWISDTVANIADDNGTYILDIQEKTLIEEEPVIYNFNFLTPPPGSIHYHCQVVDKEILIDQGTVLVIMQLMNKKISINSDFDNAIVYISDREN